MLQELITLALRITFPVDALAAVPVEAEQVDLFNAEIATLGYTFEAGVLTRLRGLTTDDFLEIRRHVLDALFVVTGASARHQVLFRGFPYDTPDARSYFFDRMVGHLQNSLMVPVEDCRILSCGHVIDRDLFDLDGFGACPICQHQVPQLTYQPTRPNAPPKPVTPLKILHYADAAWFTAYGNGLLARQGSLSAAERSLLGTIARWVPLTLPPRLFKETLPFAYRLLGAEAVRPHLSGATDVLRIAAFVSDEAADVSLAQPPRLRLSTRVRGDLLGLLEGLDDIAEDLLRHHGPWKRFAEHVHVGQARYRRRFPKTVAAFERVRRDPKGVATYDRTVERALRAGRVDARLLAVMERRPGSLLRRFDHVLRTADAAAVPEVLDSLARVAPQASSRLLLGVKKHLEHRQEPRDQRIFLPKGNANRIQIVEDGRAPIAPATLRAAQGRLAEILAARFADKPALGRVYLDPALTGLVLPFNRRGDAATSVPMAKGSRFPIAEATEVLRLFVHWTGQDVDLSLVALDEALGYVDQISWNHLASTGFVHSGDVRSAPDGASEFIDVRIAQVLGRGIRYLAVSVISYQGPTFDSIPCFAGFMERDGLHSRAVYDPATVRLKFDVGARTQSAIPLIFDLAERQVIWVDLAAGGKVMASVRDQPEKFQAMTRAALDLPRVKPTAYDVLATYASVRGQIVFTPDQADTVYRADGLDLEAVAALLD